MKMHTYELTRGRGECDVCYLHSLALQFFGQIRVYFGVRENIRTEATRMTSPLEREFEYYLDHQDEFVEKYRGKVIVIKDCDVIGVYDSDIEAVEETTKTHELGTFLVQKCESGAENIAQTFQSRAVFV